jgi:hypothetical protein
VPVVVVLELDGWCPGAGSGRPALALALPLTVTGPGCLRRTGV